MIQTRVLGTFEITISGTAMPMPSAPKLRRVLMLLVFRAGHAVSTDKFMTELWEDRPPPSAHTTLQTYIYQLRKLFDRIAEASGVRVRLETTAAGYLLRLPPEVVDAHRFESLVARGRAHLAEGETLLGIDTLNSALALWPTTSTGVMDVGSVLQAEVARLEELRRSAVEERINAELRSGRHHHVVGELLGLVASHPTHEGLQATLMLALYRCGRRSDALAAYHRARAVLAVELGLEPCTELRQMHSRILVGDPSLDLPESPPPPPPSDAGPVRVPGQLPPDAMVMGREKELETLRLASQGGPSIGRPVIVVTGAPGSGKSALCVHAAHQVRADFPDGQLWADLTTSDGRPVPPGVVLEDFLRAVGVPASRIPQDVDERARMFRSWAADRQVLVVLDDVVDLGQLLPLLPGGARSATLLTCRRRLSDPRITATVDAAPLSRTTAWNLLATSLGEVRMANEVEAISKVIELCEGLPAALRTVTSQLELRPHWSVARMLGQEMPCSRSSPPRPRLDLGPVVRRTYRLLTPSAQVAFRRLATATDQPISPDEAAALLSVTESAAEALLEDLVEVQLADVQPGPGAEDFGYRFRPVFRAAALALPCEPDELRLLHQTRPQPRLAPFPA